MDVIKKIRKSIFAILIISISLIPMCYLYNYLALPKSAIIGAINLEITDKNIVRVEHVDILTSSYVREFMIGYDCEEMIKCLESAGLTYNKKVNNHYIFNMAEDESSCIYYTEKNFMNKYKVWEESGWIKFYA